MIDLMEILARGTPPSEEELAELRSDALIGQAIILSHMNTDQESKLLTIGVMMALDGLDNDEASFILAHEDALAAVAKTVAYLVAGVTISQEWR